MQVIKSLFLASAAVLVSTASSAAPPETSRIVDEGMNHSQVMMNAHELMDGIGPRLTNSTNMHRAEDWAIAKFQGYGLTNVRREAFDFGRGWDLIDSSVRMVSPRPIQLTAIPVAWTPPTNGTVTAPIIVAPIEKKADFAAYRGQLAGKIVLTSLPGEGSEPKEAPFKRLTSEDISKLDEYQQPQFDPASADKIVKRVQFARDVDSFLASEGAVARATIAYRDGKLVSGEGYDHQVGMTDKVPRSRPKIIVGSRVLPRTRRRRWSQSASTPNISTATPTPITSLRTSPAPIRRPAM